MDQTSFFSLEWQNGWKKYKTEHSQQFFSLMSLVGLISLLYLQNSCSVFNYEFYNLYYSIFERARVAAGPIDV